MKEFEVIYNSKTLAGIRYAFKAQDLQAAIAWVESGVKFGSLNDYQIADEDGNILYEKGSLAVAVRGGRRVRTYAEQFIITPIGDEHPITVLSTVSKASYDNALKNGEYAYFDFEIVSMSEDTEDKLKELADDKYEKKYDDKSLSYYFHCTAKNMDYCYHYNAAVGAKLISVCTYKNYK